MTMDLKAGEHVDLDSGVRVRRQDGGVTYTISVTRDSGRTDHVTVSDDDVKTIAELAGYTVTGRSVRKGDGE